MELNAGSNFISNYQLLQEVPAPGVRYFDINVVWHLVSILHSGKILGTVFILEQEQRRKESLVVYEK